MRQTDFDHVFDAQAAYRVILDCFARPGRVGALTAAPRSLPDGLSRSAAIVLLTLLDGAVGFHSFQSSPAVDSWIVANTGSRPSQIEEAAFVLMEGNAPALAAELPFSGDPLYPETAATLLIQTQSIHRSAVSDSMRITLEGPGIETTQNLWLCGVNGELVDTVRRRNQEFPLGLDVLFCADEDGAGQCCIAALARTSKIQRQ